MSLPSENANSGTVLRQASSLDSELEVEASRMDVPGIIEDWLLLGSVAQARDEEVMNHLHVSYILDVENPRRKDECESTSESGIETKRVELDDDFSYANFKDSVTEANNLLRQAKEDGKTVFVCCTFGSNESVVVCLTYLMLSNNSTLEHAYKYIAQKRPSSAPRNSYIEQLRKLELEVHGKVTLRSDQVGPSMIDIMMGLQAPSHGAGDDTDESSSQISGRSSAAERSSVASNFSTVPGLVHNPKALRETMIIAEQNEDALEESYPSTPSGRQKRAKMNRQKGKGSCIIS